MASLQEAVVKGLAADRGLFMPMTIKPLPQEFYDTIDTLSFQEIAYRVADAFFGEDIPADILKQIVYDTLSFDVPLVKVTDNIYSLELFHGPTLAFKDVGGRFMARLLGYFIKKEGQKDVNVLVATSGDTGSAVANGFLGVEGIHVYVLYPKGKVSEIQEKQFTTLGQNITALEVDGTFDDCQALVKAAFMDKELNEHLSLTMDVGDPSNFARVLDLYGGSHADISAEISGTTYTDEQIRETVKETWKEHHYLLDPHGACGYRALQEGLKQGETGVFLETAHPAKFLETVESIIGEAVEIPAKLQEFMKGEKKSLQMTKEFADFKKYLLSV